MDQYVTHNTKVAAAFGSIGFAIEVSQYKRLEGDKLTGAEQWAFTIHEPNRSDPKIKLDHLVKPFEDGSMAASRPKHPLLVATRALNNRDHILKFLYEGGAAPLLRVHSSRQFAHYTSARSGLFFDGLVPTTDLAVVCAAAELGIPIVSIRPGPTRNIGEFLLAPHGFPIMDPITGLDRVYDAARLTKIGVDGRPTFYEDRSCAESSAYKAVCVMSDLKKVISSTRSVLVVSNPAHTQRYSFISEYASDAVLDRVARHFQLPNS